MAQNIHKLFEGRLNVTQLAVLGDTIAGFATATEETDYEWLANCLISAVTNIGTLEYTFDTLRHACVNIERGIGLLALRSLCRFVGAYHKHEFDMWGQLGFADYFNRDVTASLLKQLIAMNSEAAPAGGLSASELAEARECLRSVNSY